MDLWTETLEAKEYDALATMIANGVTTEIEVTAERQPQLEGVVNLSGGERDGGAEGVESGAEADGRNLGVTRYRSGLDRSTGVSREEIYHETRLKGCT